MRNLAAVCFFATVSAVSFFAQAIPAEKSNEARIESLLKRMTLEEKVDLIRGSVEPGATNQGQAGYLPGVPRLGVLRCVWRTGLRAC